MSSGEVCSLYKAPTALEVAAAKLESRMDGKMAENMLLSAEVVRKCVRLDLVLLLI